MDDPEEFNKDGDEDDKDEYSDSDNESVKLTTINNDDADGDFYIDDGDDNDDDDDDDDYPDGDKKEDAQENMNKIDKKDMDIINSSKGELYNTIFTFDDDLEETDSYDFLQKFNDKYKDNYIASKHQESLNKNLNEITNLINVIRDKNNIIIDQLHKTIPILTKYEKTRILGIRLKQLNNGALPYIKVSENILDNFIIAKKELNQKKLPFIIQRPLPNNTFEYWKLEDLEIL